MSTSQQRNEELPSHHAPGFEGTAFLAPQHQRSSEKQKGPPNILVRRQIDLVQGRKGSINLRLRRFMGASYFRKQTMSQKKVSRRRFLVSTGFLTAATCLRPRS